MGNKDRLKYLSAFTVITLLASACETQGFVSPTETGAASPQNGEVFEPVDVMSTVEPTGTLENIFPESTPTLSAVTLEPVICGYGVESRLAVLSTSEGIAASQMPVVLTQDGFDAVAYADPAQAMLDLNNKVSAAVVNLTAVENLPSRVLIPQYMDVEETEARIQGDLGIELPFELGHHELNDIVGRGELTVFTFASTDVEIFGPGSRITQRDGVNVVQGSVMVFDDTDENGQPEIVPHPGYGSGVQEIMKVNGCLPDIVTLSPRGDVLAVYDSVTESWVTPSVATPTPEMTKTPAVPPYEELIQNASMQDFWIEAVTQTDVDLDLVFPIYVGEVAYDIPMVIFGLEARITAIKTIVPDIWDPSIIREMWVPLRYTLSDGRVIDIPGIQDHRHGQEFPSVDEFLADIEIGQQIRVAYFANTPNNQYPRGCEADDSCHAVCDVYLAQNVGEIFRASPDAGGAPWPENFVLPANSIVIRNYYGY